MKNEHEIIFAIIYHEIYNYDEKATYICKIVEILGCIQWSILSKNSATYQS